ncbi:aldehyde dehydrogenase (NADP(+)) [Nesterenkonia halotolerans]|uniref:NADP-dependent aldehyde dehydrogenase n=1 Tax=Nesterenkonia halotolerans TaxID=225325 RepID=A0ABR9J7E5_9MICC|nr:aldehyde dehydrogenase (NADP(+)) [Nesterenkonia halotolerans]MBE1514903.1 NADP-dependent aldehyde dehydrogenase [Nesterenkonia halotolerans]
MDVTSRAQSDDMAPPSLEIPDTSSDELNAIVFAATAASQDPQLGARTDRASMLSALADTLESHADELVDLAQQETRLPRTRLHGEITRTAFQLREFSAAVLEGSYLEATIDSPAQTPMGPRPDLRRMLVPLGVVAVYSASNFPFAFSVLGGDTASALAAGNPVVVKAHPGHPRTSQKVVELAAEVLSHLGWHPGTITLVHGFDAGTALIQHPSVRAGAFTGSVHGGQALAREAALREEPIPFYGELGSLNPVFATQQAVTERGSEFGQGVAASVLQSGGQLCTKPGLVLIPTGQAGDTMIEHITSDMSEAQAFPALTSVMASGYARGATSRSQQGTVLAVGKDASEGSNQATVIEVHAEDAREELLEECFGPLVVVVRYSSNDEALSVANRLRGSLTATLLTGATEDISASPMFSALSRRAGRVLINDYPTGVAVSWAQHHGGPWPSTNSLHSSVGMTATRRFLRPMVWQNAPQHALPSELQDHSADVPTRVNGTLTGSVTEPSRHR